MSGHFPQKSCVWKRLEWVYFLYAFSFSSCLALKAAVELHSQHWTSVESVALGVFVY